MKDNGAGEIVAGPGHGSCSECALCLDVCPFHSDREAQIDEDVLGRECFGGIPGIRHIPEVGYWLACKEGYALPEGFRMSRSSGGIATWFLCRLLKEGVVQGVVCIVPNPDPGELFRFAILRTPSDVASASTSCYYPTSIAKMLRTVMREKQRVAITALPCVAKALRRAMRRIPSLRERVALIVGLTCGQQKSKSYTDLLVRLCGGDPARVRYVNFRKKEPGLPAKEYIFSWNTTGCRKDEEGSIGWTDGCANIWCQEHFKVNACNYCDDVFAELADVTFMDAWVSPWRDQPGGRNLIIVRRKQWAELLETGVRDGELELNDIGVDQVVESQRGVISDKRIHLGVRLWLASKRGQACIKKRVAPRKGSIHERLEARASLGRQQASRDVYRQLAGQKVTQAQYQAMVDKKCRKYEKARRALRWLTRLSARASRIKRLLGAGR